MHTAADFQQMHSGIQQTEPILVIQTDQNRTHFN